MSETQPPEGFETWLDLALSPVPDKGGVKIRMMLDALGSEGASPKYEECARAELAQLRTFKEKYLEAMGFLRLLGLSCLSEQRKHVECDLCRFFKREIAANRFTP